MDLIVNQVSKEFGRRSVFNNVSLSIGGGTCFGIFGANGSGKSTLLQIIGGIQRASSGSVQFSTNGIVVSASDLPFQCGLVAPYLRIYEEFSPIELMHIHARLRGRVLLEQEANVVLKRVGIYGRRSDPIRDFSSGLLQRVLLALAVHLSPPLLLLDEPSVTMDADGRACVENEIQLHTSSGGIVILASNDEKEKMICTEFYQL